MRGGWADHHISNPVRNLIRGKVLCGGRAMLPAVGAQADFGIRTIDAGNLCPCSRPVIVVQKFIETTRI